MTDSEQSNQPNIAKMIRGRSDKEVQYQDGENAEDIANLNRRDAKLIDL